MLGALLWDVDGTLAETERDGHRVAFNQAFVELGVPWRWSERQYGELLRVTGGRERLLHDMQVRPEAPATAAERAALAERAHRLKNAYYAQIVATGGVPLRPGVRELFDECRADGVRMAIVTTTSGANIEALLATHLGADWRSRFAAVIGAEEAPRKKPDPQAYALALQALDLPAAAAVAIEDSPAGVAAARAAGVTVVVTRSVYFAEARMPGARAIGPSLEAGTGWRPAAGPGRVGLEQLRRWHAGTGRH